MVQHVCRVVWCVDSIDCFGRGEYEWKMRSVAVFWDWQGILIRYLPKGSAINADAYCDVLKQLWCEISQKCPGCFQNPANVFLIHDNARPQSANKMQTLLQTFDWTVYNHPPYSLDLAPSDYCFFPALKTSFGGWRFGNDEVLKLEINYCFFKNLPDNFYYKGLCHLPYCYNKCLDLNGNYVEK